MFNVKSRCIKFIKLLYSSHDEKPPVWTGKVMFGHSENQRGWGFGEKFWACAFESREGGGGVEGLEYHNSKWVA